jgi:chromosome segregation ATPase
MAVYKSISKSSMSSRRAAGASPASNPLSSIDSIIAQLKEAESAATEGTDALSSLLARSDALISRHRDGLLEVARLSAELAEIEKRRSVLKAALASQKTKILVTAAETAEVNRLIEAAIDSGGQEPIASGASGAAALQAIEKIQAAVFTLTEKCMQSEKLSLGPEDADALVCTVSDVIEEAVKNGSVVEAPEDTVRRQGHVIAALSRSGDE